LERVIKISKLTISLLLFASLAFGAGGDVMIDGMPVETLSAGKLVKTNGTKVLVSSNVDSSDLDTLTNGSNADALHDHTGASVAVSHASTTGQTDSDHHAPATVSGSYDYLTLVGQDFVRGVVDISSHTNLAVTSPVALTGDTLSVSVLRDLATTAPITGAVTDIFVGVNGTRATIGLTTDKDLVTTAPLTGGGNDILPGVDVDITIAMPVATSVADGYLSSTNWSTFNGKQAAGNYITALTGDVTAVGPGSAVATIAVNAVALGTDTTGNYALGDAEAGAALTGDSATSFFSSGTIEDARLPNSISSDITGNAATASIAAAVATNAVTMGTDTTGNYIATIAGTADEVSVAGSGSETAAVTVGLPDSVVITTKLTSPIIKLTTGASAGYLLQSDADGDGTWVAPATGMTYLGGWSPTSNTPTLVDGTGASGDTYAISDSASRDLGSGSIDWTAGG